MAFIALAVSIVVLPTNQPLTQYDLVKVVTQRQGLMFDMQTAYWPLLAVKKGDGTDLAAAADAARTMSASINEFVVLLPPGTAKGEVPGSRARPEVWTESDSFSLASETLSDAATKLAEIAEAGDIEAFKLQFEAVAQACTGCHDFKPSGGGRFRFPSQ